MEGPPSRRANATLTPCPNGAHLWCVGGEFFSDDHKAVCPVPLVVVEPPVLNSHAALLQRRLSLLAREGQLSPLRPATDASLIPIIQDEWRKFVSPTCPDPRSAHAMVASPAGGGKLWLFGGEFSSLHQNSFHHYRDLWCFDVSTHVWERVDTRTGPSARSGHR